MMMEIESGERWKFLDVREAKRVFYCKG